MFRSPYFLMTHRLPDTNVNITTNNTNQGSAMMPRLLEPARSVAVWCHSDRAQRLCLLGVAILANAVAHSQVSVQQQNDFNTARSDAALGTSFSPTSPPTFGSIISYGNRPIPPPEAGPLPPTPKPFSLNFLAPFNYVQKGAEGTTTTGAAEATPELKVAFLARPGSGWMRFTGYLDEYSDRYTGKPSNGDRLSASLRMEYVGTQPVIDPDRLIPYLSYAPSKTFAPLFSKKKLTTQDYTLGINELWDFAPSFRAFDTRGGFLPTWELGLQAAAQRRIVDSGADSFALIFSPSLKWAATDRIHFPYLEPEQFGKLAASLGLTVTRRWYERYQGQTEQTWSLGPIFTVVWLPPAQWFGSKASLLGSPEVDFQLAYSDLNASLHSDNAHSYTIGPALKASWVF
jgi:hypothetical protein